MRFVPHDWLKLSSPIRLKHLASYFGLLWLPFMVDSVGALPSVSSRAIDLQPTSSPVALPALEARSQDFVLLPPATGAAPVLASLGISDSVASSPPSDHGAIASSPPAAPSSEIDAPVIESGSPLLQRWLKGVPDVLDDIRRDPSFRTRLRVGYSYFPSSDKAGGMNVGLEDLFIGRTGLTLSGDYYSSFNGKREAWGADLRYYVLPLGGYVNVAPVMGYRYLETNRYTTDGLNVGLRVLLVPTRTGAADISLTQTWVNPRTGDEVGLTTLSFGYALTRHLRLSTDLQKQNSRYRKDSRVGVSLEWMF